MNSRYLTNLALVVTGGFLLVTSRAFGASVFEWLMLGGGIVALTTAAASIGLSRRGRIQRLLDALVVVLGAWTIVASVVFGGATVLWLGFASGGALAIIALVGLTVHELSSERVVHSFELRSSASEEEHEHALTGANGSR